MPSSHTSPRGSPPQRWGTSRLEVVVLTHSKGRLRNLRDAAAEEVPEDRWESYLFATLDVVDAPDVAAFDNTDWQTLFHDDLQYLVDRTAFGDDSGEQAGGPNPLEDPQGEQR